MKNILIIDDERGSRESLKQVFKTHYQVEAVPTAAEAMERLAERRIDLVLSDVLMPEVDGLTLLKQILDLYPGLPVIMVSGATSVRPAVEAIRQGAYDYISKPFEVAELRLLAERALKNSRLERRMEILEDEVSQAYPVNTMAGEAAPFRQALAHADQAAEVDSTVLLEGESGTGKELLARRIHDRSDRRDEPFVAVHCAALPENLLESELFGYEKGAFTQADKRKLGRFDLAGSGTLFLDEIGEMPMSMQVKILRVLQEREFMRIGGTRVIRTDARIIAASNRDLKQAVQEGTFRDDLFYRISVIPVTLPPLRQRPSDIPLLARNFLEEFRKRMDVATRSFSPEALALLEQYFWPGNVRELRNLVERTLVLHRRQPVILAEFLPEEYQQPTEQDRLPTSPHCSLQDAVNAYERQLVKEALKKAGGVQTRAAEILGTTRRILRYRMEKLNIPVPGR